MAIKEKIGPTSEEELEGYIKNIDEKALARGNEFLHALEPYGQVALVREMARRIQVLDKGKEPLTGSEAAHLAQLAIAHNLNPFSGEMWGWVVVRGDKREFNWMPGYKGYMRHANEQAEARGVDWWYDEEELTEAEKAKLYIPKDALAIRCKVYDSGSMEGWRDALKTMVEGGMSAKDALKALGDPPCSVGIGVLTREEMNKLPKNNKMPHINRASKRALVQALKFKFNLAFGTHGAGSSDTFEDYIMDEKGSIDVEFEDVTPDLKERMNPEYWGGIAEGVVEAGLAKDAFVASEVMAYTPLQPQNLKLSWVLEFFQEAQAVYKENPNQNMKEVAEQAYARFFAVDQSGDSNDTEDEIAEGEFEELDFVNRLANDLGHKGHAKLVAKRSLWCTEDTQEVIYKDYIDKFKQAIEKGKTPAEAVEWVDNLVANKDADGQYKE